MEVNGVSSSPSYNSVSNGKAGEEAALQKKEDDKRAQKKKEEEESNPLNVADQAKIMNEGHSLGMAIAASIIGGVIG